MRLTSYTDYSLRVLIYLATHQGNHLVKIQDIADTYRISKNHLVKVVYKLGKTGYLDNIRGRNGGLRLALDPEEINIREVIQKMEEDFHMMECFDSKKNSCIISPACHLKGILQEALVAYLEVLGRYTLADLVTNHDQLQMIFNSPIESEGMGEK